MEKDYSGTRRVEAGIPRNWLPRPLKGKRRQANPRRKDKAIAAARAKKIEPIENKKIEAIATVKAKLIAPTRRPDPDDHQSVSGTRKKAVLDKSMVTEEIEADRKVIYELHPDLRPVIDCWELLERLPNLSAKKLNLEIAGDHHVKPVDRLEGSPGKRRFE